MLAHPSVRNDPITPWSDLPINHLLHNHTSANLDDSVQIQDDQLPPDLLPFHQPQQSLESPFQSPFQSPVHLHHLSSPLSSASASPIFSSPAFSSRSPATAVSSDFPTVFDGGLFEAPSMSATSSFNPSIHVQHSTPSPFPTPQQFTTGSPMLAQHGISSNNHGWDVDANIQLLSPARTQGGLPRRSGLQGGAAHKRASSGSSGATDSTSPQAATFNNHHQNSSSFSPSTTNLNGFADSYQNSNKALPTPAQTPVQNSLLAAPFQNYDPSSQNGDNAEAERAMRQAVMEQQQQQHSQQQSQQLPQQAAADDEAPFQYSLAPSASSLSHQNSPVTPQTTYDDFDDASKAVVRGEDRSPDFDRWMDEYLQLDARSDFNGQGAATVPVGVPKLNRTISDIYQDELYNTGVVPSPQVHKPNTSQAQNQPLMAPYRNLFADRLQAANRGHLSARSQSPANNRERSPFRQGSPLAPDFRTARLQQSGLATTMQLPHTNGMGLGNQQDNQGEPKTISPKDALLEYHEGPEDTSIPSLFPSTQAGPDYNVGGGDNLGLRRQSAFQPTQNYSQMESFPSQYAHQAAGLQQPFFLQQQQQQPNQAQQQPQHHQNNLMQQQFSVSLPTMESTTGTTAPSVAAQVQHTQNEAARRPDDTSSDTGTYTCTYHGCTLRFETPAKLQKHKREAHRQTTMAGHLAGRDSQGNPLAVRNSQAGPHKCERINPSTGKPCNSIFSRPYDLTRHEDTIHNARKQKVRCQLCTEEKTFSRNDALTRHMRVVHPDVDWPGKQRRKGRE
ncbi:hypothetical protein VTN77DRAFT_7676 [Rasamsonia byssochlamydoides]|uniref:uncharacterized protein n=1 Tax=Rasamsonia byssochlamydoides TaxID=89139 RepID=UPI0037431772